MFEAFRNAVEDRIINYLLSIMKQDTTQKLFYKKTEDAGTLLKPLRDELYPRSFFTVGQYKNAILFYSRVWIHVHGGLNPAFSKKEYICKAMRERFKQFPSDTVDEAIDVCLDYIFRNEPAMKQKVLKSSDPWLEDYKSGEGSENKIADLMDIMKLITAREAVNKQAGETAKENNETENKYLDDPDYGLVPEKPVFVNGIGAHRAYLNSLRTESGGTLEYSRLGSMPVDGIAGRVDMYSITPKDGSDKTNIYLCIYGSKTSSTAPKGFILVSEQPGGSSSSNTEVQAQFTFF